MLAVFVSCSDVVKYTITGEANEFEDGKWAYLQIFDADDNSIVLDSVKVVNNSFVIKGRSEQSFVAAVTVGENRMEDDIFVSVIVESGDIMITKTEQAGQSYVASGTPLNDKYQEFKHSLKAVVAAQDSTPEKTFAFIRPHIMADIDNIYGTFLFDNYHFSMPDEMKLKIIAAMPSHLQEKYEPMKQECESRLEKRKKQEELAKRVAEGMPYIDIAGLVPDGKELSLQSVVENKKNKFVLLEFWASWCMPCMNEVPHIKEAYGKFHNKGFEIFAVSFDDKTEGWTTTIKTKGLKWHHVLNQNNAAQEKYGVSSIPSNFLIDCATGKIIATNLRGDALAKKLSEVI